MVGANNRHDARDSADRKPAHARMISNVPLIRRGVDTIELVICYITVGSLQPGANVLNFGIRTLRNCA